MTSDVPITRCEVRHYSQCSLARAIACVPDGTPQKKNVSHTLILILPQWASLLHLLFALIL